MTKAKFTKLLEGKRAFGGLDNYIRRWWEENEETSDQSSGSEDPGRVWELCFGVGFIPIPAVSSIKGL